MIPNGNRGKNAERNKYGQIASFPWFYLQIVVLLFLFCLPHLIGLYKTKGNYTPFSVSKNVSTQIFDETSFYAAPIQKFIRNGNLFMEDVYELKGTKNPLPILPPLLVGFLTKIFSSLEIAWIFLDTFLPVVFWILAYLLIGLFTPSIPYRSLFSWIMVTVPLGPRNFLLMGWESHLQPIEITRQTSPGISLPYLLFCVLISGYAISKRSFRLCAVAGALSGLLFYLYYFYSVAFFAGGVFVLVAMALSGHQKDIKFPLLLGITGAVVSIPSMLLTQCYREAYHELLTRTSIFHHSPYLEGIVFIIIGFAVLFWFLKKNKDLSFPKNTLLLLISMLAGMGLGMNAQVFTGLDFHHILHFHNRLLQPLAVILFGIFCVYLLPKLFNSRILYVLEVLLILFVIGISFYRHLLVGNNTYAYHDKRLPRMDVLLHARKTVPPNAVIGSTDLELISLISPVTGNWNYVPHGYRTKAHWMEIIKRYFILSYLEGLSLNDAQQRYRRYPKPLDVQWVRLWTHYPYVLHMALAPRDQSILEWNNQLWKGQTVINETSKRKLDYLILSSSFSMEKLKILYPASIIVYTNKDWCLVKVSEDKEA